MKTVLFFVSFCCYTQLMAQISGPCPCGYALTIEASKFNFHKPRTDCTSGFGLCVRIRGLKLECYPCYSKNTGFAEINGDLVRGYVHFEGNHSELVLPASLLEDQAITYDENQIFSLEDGSIVIEKENESAELSSIGGDYPFEIKDGMLLIPVPFREQRIPN